MENKKITPVINQLIAYNNRDIDAFIINFSKDCVVENSAGDILMVGSDAMYESYKRMFEASPKLHCNLVSRIVVGNYVLDEERVTGRGGNDDESHVVAIYRIENDIITHVRFIR